MARKNPNIVVTGTPGVGKTTHAEQLTRNLGFKHPSVNQIVKDEGFHEGKDEETGSWIVDEDKVAPHQRSHLNAVAIGILNIVLTLATHSSLITLKKLSSQTLAA